MKPEKSFVDAGQDVQADVIVVDVDGNAVAGRSVTMKSVRLDWVQGPTGSKRRRSTRRPAPSHRAMRPTTARCRPRGEASTGTAVVADELGRKSQTVTRLWVIDSRRAAGSLAVGAARRGDRRQEGLRRGRHRRAPGRLALRPRRGDARAGADGDPVGRALHHDERDDAPAREDRRLAHAQRARLRPARRRRAP